MVKNTSWVFVRSFFVLSLLLLLSTSTYAAEGGCLYYFYGEGCPDCQSTTAFIGEMQSTYPALELTAFEVYYNRSNFHRLNEYFSAYKITEEEQALPAVFLSGNYFIGAQPIADLLEESIKDNPNEACPDLAGGEVVGVIGAGAPPDVLNTLTFSRVTSSAFANSFSISAFAILSVLLLLIISFKDKDEMMKKGLVFVGGVYLSYLLFSLGLFSWFARSPVSTLVLKVLGLAVIIIALTQVKDFLDTLKPLLRKIHAQRWMQKTTDALFSSPGVFMLGFAVTLFTLPLLNGTLLSMRTLFMLDVGKVLVFPLVLYHLFLIVLRPVFLILLVYFIRQKLYLRAEKKAPHDPLNIQKWYWHYIKVFNFILAVMVILFGLGLLFT